MLTNQHVSIDASSWLDCSGEAVNTVHNAEFKKEKLSNAFIKTGTP